MFKVNDKVILSPKSEWYKQSFDQYEIPMEGVIEFIRNYCSYKYRLIFTDGSSYHYRDEDLIHAPPKVKHNKKKLNLTIST